MIIVRYGEIGLKGKNRNVFENKLVENIAKHYKKEGEKIKIKKCRGRIFVESDVSPDPLKKVFGIVSYSPAIETELSIDSIYNVIKELISKRKERTFRVSAQRLWKEFEYDSMELNRMFGEKIINDFSLSVNLKTPELNVGIEITRDHAYVFTEKIEGLGGLPVGIEGKVVSLLSGGIDSPVAVWMMMKRGVTPILVHFYHNEEQRKRVESIARKLESYSPDPLKLVFVDHLELINKFVHNLYSLKKQRWTCVFCRYSMLKKAEELANKHNAKAIITGESLGQVASQTLSNIEVENQATILPILRPLIGMDKVEIVERSKKIGTYDLSILVKGCGCPFLPSYPITSANLKEFETLKQTAFSNIAPEKMDFSKVSKKSC